MSVRSLELFDLPTVHRYRAEALPLDSVQAMTRGNPLRAANFLAHLDPTRRIYTGVADDEPTNPLLGCVIQDEGEPFARLTYLAPAGQLDGHTALPALIEHLTIHAGKWGAHQVLAEVDESAALFQSLRRGGFAVYAWQRIWDLSDLKPATGSGNLWFMMRHADLLPVQGLRRQIVPPLLQQIEVFAKHSDGLVCQADGLQAYVDLAYGPQGILVQPLIHPNTEDVGEKLINLLAHLADRRGRPVYLCVRSYQAWLEMILAEMGAAAGPRQAVMVKHLVNVQRITNTVPANTDTAWVNPAASIRKTTKSTNG
ncbi:MAG: hypothetical protein GXP40_10315 [Chloroflexi bacterium]|nr:hypothetical protein [Chloroflexota bacterium]